MNKALGFCLAGLCAGSAWGATVEFGADKIYGAEGEASVSLPVILSSAADATVRVAIAGTATNGIDFTCSTTLVFSVSGSATNPLAFSVADDDLPEGPESARLTLNLVSGATLGSTTQAVLFIRDNDAFSVATANLTSGTNEVNQTTTYDDPGGRILEALCPDVVLIQEWVLKSGTTYRGFVDDYFGTNFSYFVEYQTGAYAQPNGIISRWPIVASNEWADAELSNRDFATATIDLPGSRVLHAVCMHLKATDEDNPPGEDAATRLAEARVLTNYLAAAGWPGTNYLVIGGDLNLSNRTEAALAVLTNVASDAHQPADQDGDKDTNSGRYRPYDLILPSPNLDARHCSIAGYGEIFPNGLVFDTRETWNGGVPPPARATDSDATNMQHMAVMKVFELENAPPAPPVSIWASATNATDFTAAWSAVPEATGYRLDVGTNATFTSGDGGVATPIDEDFGDFSDWTDGGTASDSSHYGASSPCRALGAGDTLTSPPVNYPTQLTFYADASSSGNGFVATNYYSLDGGASWTPLGAFTVGTNGATETQSLTSSPDLSGSTGVTFRFASAFSTWYLDDVRVMGLGTGEPSYISSYSNRTVAGTGQSVTGLVASGTYFFRVRAVADGDTSSNSAVASVSLPEAAPDAPAAIWASATNATGFTAAWSAASGAASYRLDVGTNATFAAGGGTASSLFLSEYIEGTSNNKAVEIFNGTGSAVDLGAGNYDLRLYFNGSTSYTTIDLTGTIANGDVFVVANSSAIAAILAQADLTSGSLNFNGNDVVALAQSGVNLDVVGALGVNVTNLIDVTKVRNASISAGNATYAASEWSDHAADTTGYLGAHSFSGGGTPAYVSGYSNRTVAGTSESVTGLVAGATYYFRARAVNGGGTSSNSATAGVATLGAGTPPAVDAIPAQVTSVGAEFEYAVTATATEGDPILSFACTSAVDTNTWLLDENTGDFLFIPTAAQFGTNTFSFTATDKDGTSAPVAMSVKVYSAAATNAFTQWVEDQEEDPADPDFAENADGDGDGADTYEEYLADTDPAASNSVLALSGTYFTAAQVGDDTGQIRFSFPASPARYYQLEYCTDLTNQVGVVVSNLGWGVPGMVVTSDAPASWYGVIRSRLTAP